jgi:putative inorganic carbon (HCO3(-)) transporter
MLSNIIKKISSKFVLYGLPLFYFLVAVSFYLGTYDSAQIKITIVQIGGILLILSWLVYKFEYDFFYNFKKNIIILLPILLFLTSGLISYFHSPYQLASTNEFVRRFIYCFLAIIIIDCFEDKNNLLRLVKFLIFATYVVCIYAVVQFIDTRCFPPPPEKGFDPFVWRWAFDFRLFSTFGNPNFFGDFLVVMNPIVLALFLKKRKVHLLFLWILIAFSTIFSYSKGAWLGFGAGLLIFVFLFVSFILNIEKRKKIIIISLVSLFTMSVLIGSIFFLNKSRPDSSYFRLFTWLSCWEMINTKPILGTGIGTFYLTYPSYRRPQIFFIESLHNTETDHPENEYLEVFYDEGMVGLGIFLLLLITFLTIGLRNLSYFKKTKIQPNILAYLQLGFITALSAQIIHNCVCVSLRFVSSGVMLWMLIGCIGAVAVGCLNKKQENGYIVAPAIIKRVCQTLLLLMTIYLVYIFYGFFQADILHSKAIQYSKIGDWTKAIEIYSKVIEKNKSFIMARYFKANNYNDRWQNNDPEKALAEYNNIWNLAPNYVQSKFLAGLVYAKLTTFFNSKATQFSKEQNETEKQKAIKNRDACFKMAIKYFNQYKMIDPIFPQTYYQLALLYGQSGNYELAEQEYLQHLNFTATQPKPNNFYTEDWKSRRTEEYAQTCINLGNLEFMLNRMDNSEQAFIESLKYIPNNAEGLKSLSAVYIKKKDKEKYEQIVEKLKQLYPEDPYVKELSPTLK